MLNDGSSKLHATIHDTLYDLNIDINTNTSKKYPPEPKALFRSSFSICVEILQRVLKDLEGTYVDQDEPYVKITTDPEHVSFAHNLGVTVLRREDPGVSQLNSPEKESASYMVGRILRFLRIVKLTTVLIQFTHNVPMRITTEVDDAKFTF